MKGFKFLAPPPLYAELSWSSLYLLRGANALAVPLERSDNGRLTVACRERVILAVKGLVAQKGWPQRPQAFCAIGASGVSVRRLSLPTAAGEQFDRLVLLQIESEFPLAPDELAWGCQRLGATAGDPKKTDLGVAAVRKDLIEEYSSLLHACGVQPAFTLAALARGFLCPQPAGSYAVLDAGPNRSEWGAFENGALKAIRVFPFGSERLLAEEGAMDALTAFIRSDCNGQHIYLTGAGERQINVGLAARLASRLGNSAECTPLHVPLEIGTSAAVAGLKKCIEAGGTPPLVLRLSSNGVEPKLSWSDPALRKRMALCASLLLALLMLPYAEAVLLKPFLSRKLAAVKSQESRLATIDQEMDFMQTLKASQPPYLDALYLFAQSAPPGARLDSLTMNRRGEISLRGSMRNSQEVLGFRSKLIDSGFFSSVSVEEQVPTPDRQKVSLRITARWKPLGERKVPELPRTSSSAKTAKEPHQAPKPEALPAAGRAPSPAVPSTNSPPKS